MTTTGICGAWCRHLHRRGRASSGSVVGSLLQGLRETFCGFLPGTGECLRESRPEPTTDNRRRTRGVRFLRGRGVKVSSHLLEPSSVGTLGGYRSTNPLPMDDSRSGPGPLDLCLTPDSVGVPRGRRDPSCQVGSSRLDRDGSTS